MREEEAKTKWCPIVRCAVHYGPNTVSVNRDEEVLQVTCIGSECMMWVTNGFSNVGDCGLKREPEANG